MEYKSNNKRETDHDFMNVESLSQLPFIWSAPKEKVCVVKLFGIELFNNQNVVVVSPTQESKSCEDANRNNNNNNHREGESSRRFECHYCFRNFPTSQALGGHQNAHKRERQHAKRRPHLQHGLQPFPNPTHVYGLMSYHALAAAPSAVSINHYPSWNTNSLSATTSATASAAPRFYGAPYSPAAGATWSISAAPSFGSRERSLLNSLPMFPGSDEMRKLATATAVGGGPGRSHQTGFVYEAKTADQVSLDLHL